MALDFPNSPTTGSIYTSGGVSWMWDGTKWTNVSGLVAPSGRNFLHNALMNVQQRGQGPWTTTNTYTADRWLLSISTDSNSVSVVTLADSDRAAIGDEAAIYALQDVFTGSTTSGATSTILHRIENVRRTSGKTVTFSFWARATVGTPRIGIGYAQVFGTGGSPSTAVTGNIGTTPALSTTWQRYSVTNVIPSSAGKTFGTTLGTDFIQTEFWFSDQGTGANRSGGIGVQSGTVQLWGIQLELGSAATPLEKLDPRLDLANCQRFYQTGYFGLMAYAPAVAIGVGTAWALPVTMRAIPTLVITSEAAHSGMGTSRSLISDIPGEVKTNGTSDATGGAINWQGYYTASADL